MNSDEMIVASQYVVGESGIWATTGGHTRTSRYANQLTRFPPARPKHPVSGFHVRLHARGRAAHTPLSPYAGPRFHNPYTPS